MSLSPLIIAGSGRRRRRRVHRGGRRRRHHGGRLGGIPRPIMHVGYPMHPIHYVSSMGGGHMMGGIVAPTYYNPYTGLAQRIPRLPGPVY